MWRAIIRWEHDRERWMDIIRIHYRDLARLTSSLCIIYSIYRLRATNEFTTTWTKHIWPRSGAWQTEQRREFNGRANFWAPKLIWTAALSRNTTKARARGQCRALYSLSPYGIMSSFLLSQPLGCIYSIVYLFSAYIRVYNYM